ncbi:MAG: hypothetical protein ABIO82_00465 [Ginsengibacter sp.]
MHKLSALLLLLLCLLSKTFGQISPTDQKLLDSLLQHDDFLRMIDQIDADKSYARLNFGIGNGSFSSYNKSLEHSADLNNKLVFTPSIGYYHKSGFGATVTTYFLSGKNSLDMYQFSLSPGYTYSSNEKFTLSVAYIHYFKNGTYSSYQSPINNEIYSSVFLKKGFLKLGISFGYSTGNYREIVNVDTVVLIANRPTSIKFTDTATTKLSSFSVTPSVEHDFIFHGLFSTKDGVRLTPQLLVVAGINNFSVTHRSSSNLYNAFTKKKLRRLRRFHASEENGKFEIQSIGLDIDASYSFGKIYLEPEVYFDYYLPSAGEKALTSIYAINIGITF